MSRMNTVDPLTGEMPIHGRDFVTGVIVEIQIYQDTASPWAVVTLQDDRDGAFASCLVVIRAHLMPRLERLKRSRAPVVVDGRAATMQLPDQRARRHVFVATHLARRLRLDDLTAQQLDNMVWRAPLEVVAMRLSTTRQRVMQRCADLGVERPGRGFWTPARKARPPQRLRVKGR
jgi:hypothetical protein